MQPAELLALYGGEIYRFCRSLAPCTADAEDLFQDTFLAALTQSAAGKPVADVRRHLYATAVYTWKSAKRKYARRENLAPTQALTDDIPARDCLAQAVETGETAQLVHSLVAALPEKYRVPVTLFYACDLPVREIAATLRMPEGTVKSRLFKARALLEKGLVDKL